MSEIRQPRQRKRSQPTLIGDLLTQGLGKNPQVAQKVHQYKLWSQWNQLVGAQIAAQAQPQRMQGTTLVLGVTNHAWIQELSMMRPQLLAKVQQVLSPKLVTEIRLELARPLGM